jgi:hypothetical protein
MRRLKLVVTVAFEPGRVGIHTMIDAYARLVPIHQRRTARSGIITDDKSKPAIWSYRRVPR